MTTRPYELLARFGADGKVSGVSIRTITTVDGRDFESDPRPLDGVDDPAFAGFAKQFGAAVTAERDALTARLATLTSERDVLQNAVNTIPDLTAKLDSLKQSKAELEAEVARLTALVPAPLGSREITPREFLSRISQDDKLAIWNSGDPRCAFAMMELFSATSINLDSPVLAGMIDMLVEAGVEIDATERARIFA